MKSQNFRSSRAVAHSRTCALLFVLLGLASAPVHAQAPAAAPAKDQDRKPPEWEGEKPPKRVLVGVRVRGTPLRQYSVMGNQKSQRTTNSPLVEYDYVTTSRSFPVGAGFLGEVRMGRHLMFRAEAIHQGLKYDKVTDQYAGTARDQTTVTERTSATTWEIPAMLQFRPAAPRGILKNIYFAGGGALRTISNISTYTSTTASDTTSSNPAPTSKKNLLGIVAAIGFRLIDDVHINVTPEIRMIRWQGHTFSSDSTQSPRTQLEAGFAFTF
jgi:hypothetical protein